MVKEICPLASEVRIENYFENVKIFSFDPTFIPVYGFSSFDGSRLYLNNDFLQKSQNEIDRIKKQDLLKLMTQVVEHESMHNLSRFLGIIIIFLLFLDSLFLSIK